MTGWHLAAEAGVILIGLAALAIIGATIRGSFPKIIAAFFGPQ